MGSQRAWTVSSVPPSQESTWVLGQVVWQKAELCQQR